MAPRRTTSRKLGHDTTRNWAHSAREIGSHALLSVEACPATMTEPSGGQAIAGEGIVDMWSQMVDRITIEADLHLARKRSWALTPYSPAWDAAMAMVEDLERALWCRDHPALVGSDHRVDETRLSPAHA